MRAILPVGAEALNRRISRGDIGRLGGSGQRQPRQHQAKQRQKPFHLSPRAPRQTSQAPIDGRQATKPSRFVPLVGGQGNHADVRRFSGKRPAESLELDEP